MSETKRAAVNEWYDTTLSSRLDSKTEDVIVLIMQRLHVDDLVGHVLEKGEAWTHLNLPAIAEPPQEIELGEGSVYHRAPGEVLHPEREPLAVLDELKAADGEPGVLGSIPAGAGAARAAPSSRGTGFGATPDRPSDARGIGSCRAGIRPRRRARRTTSRSARPG